ncbi:hypothetical protein DC090_06820 [Trueperella pyogenes]|nr:hypothetical protein DC090_06820 [Trueperella pyogenes]AWG16884.1 hypothetical protein DDE06_08750 [Trueperella pyogenes]AZR00867.1 hypothetical protein EB776_05850 [Trueperella pyogenes]AZR03876.1 hypothetical protein EBQ11_00565 [Trueperella pyogenes]
MQREVEVGLSQAALSRNHAKVIAAAVKTADTAAGILLQRQRNAPEQELNKKTSAERRSYESAP